MQNIQFPNVGYTQRVVEETEIVNLTAEIASVREDHATVDHSHVGTVTREYRVTDPRAMQELADILQPMLESWLKNNHYVMEDRPVTLTDAWFNLQTAGEYLIPHTHKGVFSFALWISVPFTLDEEREYRERVGKPSRALSCFSFQYTDSLGRITPREIPVDRSWERTIILFPGDMTHSVTPFYSTDEYRIVVSGNIEYV